MSVGFCFLNFYVKGFAFIRKKSNLSAIIDFSFTRANENVAILSALHEYLCIFID